MKNFVYTPNHFDLLHENTPWNWTQDHEHLFQQLKTALTSETEPTIPNAKNIFFITADESLVGLGDLLSHFNECNKSMRYFLQFSEYSQEL